MAEDALRNMGPNTVCLINALEKRGIDWRLLESKEITVPGLKRRSILTFRLRGGSTYYFNGCFFVSDPKSKRVPGPMIDGPMSYLLGRKDLTKVALRSRGISVPEGVAVKHDARREAESFFQVFVEGAADGVCVKPVSGKWGRQVHIGVHDLSSFRIAFAAVTRKFAHVLIEEVVKGTAYRFFCLDGRVIAIRAGIPCNVRGDAVHSIAELIDIKNTQRRQFPSPEHALLRLGDYELEFLKAQGLHPADVPNNDETVWLGATSNLHNAADIVDVTDTVHKSYVALVEKAVKAFSVLMCGVDVMIQDASAPASGTNYHVLEINLCPGFWAHHHPHQGEPRDIASAIIDRLTTYRR